LQHNKCDDLRLRQFVSPITRFVFAIEQQEEAAFASNGIHLSFFGHPRWSR
jgi:hypothetical protein